MKREVPQIWKGRMGKDGLERKDWKGSNGKGKYWEWIYWKRKYF